MVATDQATRLLGLYGDSYWIMYMLFSISLGICLFGLWQRGRGWRLGKGELRDRLDHIGHRLMSFATIFTQRPLLREKSTGIPHALIFWSFLLFAVGTFSLMLQEHFQLPTFQGDYYLALTLAMDLFTLFAIAGLLGLAMHRRRKPFSERQTGWWQISPLVLIGSILVSGLFLEGVRIAMGDDPWAKWSPAGLLVSALFVHATADSLYGLHASLWWLHVLLVGFLVAVLPWTRLLHLVTAPVGRFLANPLDAIRLPLIDFDNEAIATYGASRINEFHWKSLFDLDACVSCGRCHAHCPAVACEKDLSPQKVSDDLKSHLDDILRHTGEEATTPNQSSQAAPSARPAPLVDAVVSSSALWACTTCRACEVHCPMTVEHIPRLIELRRNQVMMESSFPEELVHTFRGLEQNANPWGFNNQSRADWAAEFSLKTFTEQGGAEYLFWPGCSGAYDARNQKVAVAMVQILRAAGVDFAILGAREMCCGDSARRLGHEYLYQNLARANIEQFNQCRITKIITTCPHCFNAFQNEYPQLGGQFEVIPHVEMISRLLTSGAISLGDQPSGGSRPVAYHDPCYLARYNQITEPARETLDALAGIDRLELQQNRMNSFCCGGGGGRMWLEETSRKAPGKLRMEQADEAGARYVVTACPFCLSMLSDAKKSEDAFATIQVQDLAEVVAAATVQEGGRR